MWEEALRFYDSLDEPLARTSRHLCMFGILEALLNLSISSFYGGDIMWV
jgi:hypothetical protein